MDLQPGQLHYLDELELERYSQNDMISLGRGPPQTQIMVYPWRFDLGVKSQLSSNLEANAEINITESYDEFVQRIKKAPRVRQWRLKRTHSAAF